MSLTRCPICGSRLEATAKHYYECVVLSEDGEDVKSNGKACSEEPDDFYVYCYNDHTQAEMVDHLKESGK